MPFEGAEIARLARDAFVALYANNYMSSDREDLIKAWIGNLNAERARQAQAAQGVRPAAPPLSISPALRRAYDRLDAGQPVVFATLNSHRELASLASLITDEQARRFIEESGRRLRRRPQPGGTDQAAEQPRCRADPVRRLHQRGDGRPDAGTG